MTRKYLRGVNVFEVLRVESASVHGSPVSCFSPKKTHNSPTTSRPLGLESTLRLLFSTYPKDSSYVG